MYRFDSRRKYPPIVRHGTLPFSKGSAPSNILITNISPNETSLVAIEEDGWFRQPAYYDSVYNGTNHLYVTPDGQLYINLNDSASRSGTIHWRIYNNA